MAALVAGDRLGPYEIQARLGAGGMGVVYRALDPRLGRGVAIKVINDDRESDPVGRQRFLREGRSIAALSHPHICTIHEIGEYAGRAYLVMELLDGQTLSTRLRQAPNGLPLGEALAVVTQIAEALAFAHRHGIVHRDVKPANVVLTPGGVKLLDFGLARRFEAEGSTEVIAGRATLTLDQAVVGTLAYMAPEQIDGRADARSDIFALGAVMFEAFTGRPAFAGDTPSAILGAIVQGEPPSVTAARPQVPAGLDRIVARCLAKRPDDRWQSASDLAEALRWLATDAAGPSAQAGRHGPGPWRRAAAVGVATLAAVAALATAYVWTRDPPDERRSSQLALRLPAGTNIPFFGPGVALSPDGGTVALIAGSGSGMIESRNLYIRRLDSAELQVVPGTDNATYPFFSPDGRSVGFFAHGKLQRLDLPTGSISVIATELVDGGNGAAAAWESDGTIRFGEHSDYPSVGIRAVQASDGRVQILTRPDQAQSEQTHFGPLRLPETDTLLYTVRSRGKTGLEFRIDGRRADGTSVRGVVPGASLARYLGDGQLVYQAGNDLMLATIDPVTLAVSGSRRLAQGIAGTFSGATWDVTADILVYQPLQKDRRRLVWVDRQGQRERLGTAARDYTNPLISPDGRRAAVTIDVGARPDVWMADLAQQTLTPLTRDGLSGFGVWSRDGSEYFTARINGAALDVAVQPSDGRGASETLLQTGERLYPVAALDSGRALAVLKLGPPATDGIFRTDATGTRVVEPVIHSPAQELGGRVSPDARWFSFFSNASGRVQLHVAAFPAGRPQWQLSRDGAREAIWSKDGRELFFRNGDEMLAVAVGPGDPSTWALPRLLFKGEFFQQGGPASTHYDVTADGRFLMIEEAAAAPPGFTVVQGWSRLAR